MHLPHGLAWANAVASGLFSRDARGKEYQLQYYPQVGLGRIVALHHISSTSYRIREDVRRRCY